MAPLPRLDATNGQWVINIPVSTTYDQATVSRILGVRRATIKSRVECGTLEADEAGRILHSSLLESVRLEERRLAGTRFRKRLVKQIQEEFK